MGLYISLYLSPSVTQEEWEPVYEEALVLAKEMKLCNYETFRYKGVEYTTRKLTEEVDSERGKCWMASGSFYRTNSSETFCMHRNLGKKEIVPGVPLDPIYLESVSHYKDFDQFFVIWDIKFFSYRFAEELIGIAAFIDARLGGRTYLNGDIKIGMVQTGVTYINKVLKDLHKKPVPFPSFIDSKRLLVRLDAMDIDRSRKLDIFWKIYAHLEMKIPKAFQEFFTLQEKLNYIPEFPEF